jgi:hypothetical protein
MVFGKDKSDFRGRWVGSRKILDLAIEIVNNNEVFKRKSDLEVNFTKSYEKLCEDAKLWLEGSCDVSRICLVKFTEDPLYQCPISFDDDSSQIPLEEDKVFDEDIILQGEYGPAIYKGYRWVGQISVALETWSLGEDRIAGRYGDRIDLLLPS